MTVVISALFFVASAAVAALGFMSLRSDIQIIIAIIGVMFAGLFLVTGAIASSLRALRRDVEDLEDDLVPGARKDAGSEFGEALQAYQKFSGEADASAAIRSLAADALKHQGFLR